MCRSPVEWQPDKLIKSSFFFRRSVVIPPIISLYSFPLSSLESDRPTKSLPGQIPCIRISPVSSPYPFPRPHITQGNPCPPLPTPKSNSASQIFLRRDPGFVPARMDSRVTGPDGGTSAGGIYAHSIREIITFRAIIIHCMTGESPKNCLQDFNQTLPENFQSRSRSRSKTCSRSIKP